MKRKDLMLKLARTLVKKRATLRGTLAEHTSMIAVDDCSVGDSIDAAVDGEQDELDSQLAAIESRELAAIGAALKRIRDGLHGICEGCEKPIPTARLQALPYATLCIKCQREAERLGHGRTAPFHWQRVTDELSDDQPNDSNGLELQLA